VVISRAASCPFLPVSAPSGVPAEHFPPKIPELTLLSFYHHERAFANKGGTGHWPVPSGDPPDGTGEALFLPADIIRHRCFVIRHSQTEIIKNPRNITFYALKPHPTTTQRIVANPRLVGRVTPCAPRLACKRTSFLQPPPSQCFTFKKHMMQVLFVSLVCYARSQSTQDAKPRRH